MNANYYVAIDKRHLPPGRAIARKLGEMGFDDICYFAETCKKKYFVRFGKKQFSFISINEKTSELIAERSYQTESPISDLVENAEVDLECEVFKTDFDKSQTAKIKTNRQSRKFYVRKIGEEKTC